MYRLVFITVIILIFHLGCFSQDRAIIDSLSLVLKNRSSGGRFPALYELAFQYIPTDKAKALALIKEAEEAALAEGDSLAIVKSKRVRGEILYRLEKNVSARQCFDSAHPISVRNGFQGERNQIERMLGKVNMFSGNYDQALRYFLMNLDDTETIHDKEQLVSTLSDVGLAYYKLADYERAIYYFDRAVSIHGLLDRRHSFLLTNLGLCYASLGDHLKAKQLVEKGRRICNNCPDIYETNIEYAFGVINRNIGALNTAEQHFLRSYEIASAIRSTRFQLDNIYSLMEIYSNQNRFEEMRKFVASAEAIIEQHPPFNLELIKLFSIIYQFYLLDENYRQASFYQSRYISLKDSIHNESLTKNLMRIEAEYAQRENRELIASQNQIITLKEQVIRRQKWILLLAVAVSVLAILSCIFFYRNFLFKKRINVILEKRIRQRTCQLELSQRELLRKLRERELVINNISRGVVDTLSTVNGLCLVAISDVREPVSRVYLNKVVAASRRLSSYLLKANHPI